MAFGINYLTAPRILREKLALNSSASENLMRRMMEAQAINEILILSTCNRTELYGYVEEATQINLLLQCFCQETDITHTEIQECFYSYHDECAVRHLMGVASGIHSMVLGEVEIFGQIKSAFRLAERLGTLGKYLGRLFQTSFSVAKQVRSQTGIGLNPLSVAGIAVKLAERIFTDIKQATVLLVGAGDLIRLAGIHLKEAGVRKIMVANRSQIRGGNLAQLLGAEAITLEQIPERLFECDIVLTGTGSPLPLLGKGMIERALKKRKGRTLFMIDLAMPRDIEPEVSKLDAVYLYCLEDLQNILQENRHKREKEIEMAKHIIQQEAQDFMRWYRAQGAFSTLKAFRQKFEVERDQVLAQGLQHLKLGKSPEMVLQQAIHHMTNRLLHIPTKRLRQAGFEDEQGLLRVTRELFELSTLHEE